MYPVRKACMSSFKAFAFHKPYVDTAHSERGSSDQAHPNETRIDLCTLVATYSVFSVGSVGSKDPRRRQPISHSLTHKGAQTEWRMVTTVVRAAPACEFCCQLRVTRQEVSVGQEGLYEEHKKRGGKLGRGWWEWAWQEAPGTVTLPWGPLLPGHSHCCTGEGWLQRGRDGSTTRVVSSLPGAGPHGQCSVILPLDTH